MISSGLPPLTLASEAPSSWLWPPFTTASPRLALCPWSTRQHPPLHQLCPPSPPPAPSQAALLQLLLRASPTRGRKLQALALPWPSDGAVLPSSRL